MIITSITGEDEINKTLNVAMEVTVDRLIQDGLLDEEAGDKFLHSYKKRKRIW